MVKVLALEPFYGGSHRTFLDGLVQRSRHEFHLLTLPGSFWKWRMRGAAITLADQARRIKFRPDLILASDMLSLADFKSLLGVNLPSLLYMHENQLSYPAPDADPRDLHFGFTNLTSCLGADVVAWNSQYHLESFLSALPAFLRMMPDHRPARVARRIREKSLVIYPGIDLSAMDQVPRRPEAPPLVLWNHRWEFDKRPERFFQALAILADRGLPFRMAVLGQNFQAKPKTFLEARDRFADRIVQFGFVEDRVEYLGWLRRASISVSTAAQENFGLAAVEAAYAGARPLWPNALSYPELLPASAGREHLYSDFDDLVVKLDKGIKTADRQPGTDPRLASHLSRYDWSNLIGRYDDLMESVAHRARPFEPA